MELNNSLYNKITKLSEEGDILVDNENLNGAIEKYQAALELVPDSKYNWEASTWLYTALGDTCYLNQQYDEALNYLFEALKCPDGLGNPFILLRIGESFFEIHNKEKAQEYLLQAYMYAGREIFDDEPEKYINEIKKML